MGDIPKREVREGESNVQYYTSDLVNTFLALPLNMQIINNKLFVVLFFFINFSTKQGN